jgi:hypothetical protein
MQYWLHQTPLWILCLDLIRISVGADPSQRLLSATDHTNFWVEYCWDSSVVRFSLQPADATRWNQDLGSVLVRTTLQEWKEVELMTVFLFCKKQLENCQLEIFARSFGFYDLFEMTENEYWRDFVELLFLEFQVGIAIDGLFAFKLTAFAS